MKKRKDLLDGVLDYDRFFGAIFVSNTRALLVNGEGLIIFISNEIVKRLPEVMTAVGDSAFSLPQDLFVREMKLGISSLMPLADVRFYDPGDKEELMQIVDKLRNDDIRVRLAEVNIKKLAAGIVGQYRAELSKAN